MKHLTTFISSLLLAITLTACSSVGVPEPKTFNERLAIGYATVSAVRGSATTLLQAKKINITDAQNVQSQADTAREGLDIAVSLQGTDLSNATTRLDASLKVLNALQSYLNTRSTQ